MRARFDSSGAHFTSNLTDERVFLCVNPEREALRVVTPSIESTTHVTGIKSWSEPPIGSVTRSGWGLYCLDRHHARLTRVQQQRLAVHRARVCLCRADWHGIAGGRATVVITHKGTLWHTDQKNDASTAMPPQGTLELVKTQYLLILRTVIRTDPCVMNAIATTGSQKKSNLHINQGGKTSCWYSAEKAAK